MAGPTQQGPTAVTNPAVTNPAVAPPPPSSAQLQLPSHPAPTVPTMLWAEMMRSLESAGGAGRLPFRRLLLRYSSWMVGLVSRQGGMVPSIWLAAPAAAECNRQAGL